MINDAKDEFNARDWSRSRAFRARSDAMGHPIQGVALGRRNLRRWSALSVVSRQYQYVGHVNKMMRVADSMRNGARAARALFARAQARGHTRFSGVALGRRTLWLRPVLSAGLSQCHCVWRQRAWELFTNHRR